MKPADAFPPDFFPVGSDIVERMFGRALITGGLHRIPRKQADRLVVLAVSVQALRRRIPYTEPELNEELAHWLQSVHAAVDHVTLRRYLVDLGFLKRDRAGNRYFLNFLKVKEVLTEPAMAFDAAAVGEERRTFEEQRQTKGRR